MIHTHMTVNMFWLLENSFLSNVKTYLQKKNREYKTTNLFICFILSQFAILDIFHG